MHEFGIASDVLAAAHVEADRVGGGTLSVIGVRLGGDSGVDPDALRTSFQALVEHHGLGDLSLEIEPVGVRHRCLCGNEFDVDGIMAICPECGSFRTERLPGPGLDITFLEFREQCESGNTGEVESSAD